MEDLIENGCNNCNRALAIGLILIIITGCSTKMVNEIPADEPQAMEPTTEEESVEIIPLDPAVAGEKDAASADTEMAAETAEVAVPAAQPAQDPVPRPNIAGMIKGFTEYRNTLWRSRSSSYVLYIGGTLAAEYSPNDEILAITTDSADGNLECKYTMSGKLDSPEIATQRACSNLVETLNNHITI